MKREEFAKKISWPRLMFWLGLLNPLAFVPQIWKILSTGNVDGISLPMFILFLIIQLSFALNGFFQRDRAVMVSMGASAILTSFAIGLVIYYR